MILFTSFRSLAAWLTSFCTILCLVGLSACERSQRTPERPSPEAAPSGEGGQGDGGDKTVDLSFASGTSARTVADTLAGFAIHDYLVRASGGQRLKADLRTPGPPVVLVIDNEGYAPENFQTVEPDAPDGGDAYASGFSWEGTLPHEGAYRVRVIHSGPAANQGAVSPYVLTVAIEGTRARPSDRLPASLTGKFDETRAACAEPLTFSRLVVSPDTLKFYYGYATVDSVASRTGGYDVQATLYELEGVVEVVPQAITYRIEPTDDGVLFSALSRPLSPLLRCDAP